MPINAYSATGTSPDGPASFISALVPAGHASTPGYTDALYPVAGRVAAR